MKEPHYAEVLSVIAIKGIKSLDCISKISIHISFLNLVKLINISLIKKTTSTTIIK